MKSVVGNIDKHHLGGLTDILDRIKSKKEVLDASRPLSVSVLNRLKEDLSLEWTYNSNSIEGNSLTMVETKIVLYDGMTIGGKSLREHFEAINHDKAIQHVEELADASYTMRSLDVLNIHEIVLANIDAHMAGRIRNTMVRIMGANFTPPSPQRVSDLLDELIDYVNYNPQELTIPILATVFHHQFVWIHPFADGNGRTGRLIMNLLLLSKGYPPCIILKNDRKKYYNALNRANKGDYNTLALLVLQGIERSLNFYINAIPSAGIEYESIADIAEDPGVPYGMEYISLLARKGKINAHKEGRNWVSSKEDVMQYARSKGKL